MKLSLKTTFYWSLGGHAVFLLVVLVGSLFTSCSRSRSPKEVHVFRLQAGPPAPRITATTPPQQQQPAATTPPREVAPPQPKPLPKPKPQQTPAVEKKTDPKKTEIKPDKKPEPVSYDEFLKHHELPTPSQPQPPVAQPVKPTPGQTPPDPNIKLRKEIEQMIEGFGGTDTTSDELQEFNQYIGQLRAQLNRLWIQPDNLQSGKWSALIEFTVERNGKVSHVHFKEKSGNIDFDQSLIRAMNAFVSTAPPPGAKSQVFIIPFSMTVK